MNWIKEECYIGNHKLCDSKKNITPCYCKCHDKILVGDGEPFNPDNKQHVKGLKRFIKKIKTYYSPPYKT